MPSLLLIDPDRSAPLRDCTGPLYDEPWPGYLAQWLTRARDALCPHSADS
jgi:hypothetical protein